MRTLILSITFMLLLAGGLGPDARGARGAGNRNSRQAPQAEELSRRAMELLTRIHRAQEAGPGTSARAFEANIPYALVQVEKAQLHLASAWGGTDKAAEALEDAERALRLLAEGKEIHDGAAGLVERAYLSPTDGSAQPYWVYVPKAKPPKEGWPLLVYLHGYVPSTSKIDPWLPTEEFWELSEEKGFAVAVPHGRKNTDFEGIGEQDVLTVIEETKRHYPIDPDRVFMGGPSMGGYGTYVIGLHHPHLFAGLVPMCGRSIPYVVEERYPDNLPEFKRIAVDPNVPITLAENAKNLPVYLQQGERDYLTNPAHSRRLAAKWRQLGCPITYEEWRDHDHYIYWKREAHAKAYDWAKKLRRNSEPREVVYTTFTPKYRRAYWVEIEGIVEWGKPARIRARVDAGNRIVLSVENATACLVSPPASLLQAGKPLQITVNGRRETRAEWKPGAPLRIELAKLAGPLVKSADLCGPVREVFLSPFLLVPGTQGDPADERQLSEWADRWVEEWYAFAEGIPPVKPDIAVTDEEMRQYNLVLFGDRRTNAILARIADRLPVELTPAGYRVGRKETPAEGLGLLMVYPNPLAPERLVCVYSGEFWGDGLDINHKFDLAPDFIFFRKELDVADPSRTPTAICAGYFDSSWQQSDALTWRP
ncbi:MAG TPA: prolyl oligopeptidase family serine peptidase [Armatimonadota bacterium]|jgi:acetyl esterase/lipase|nr:prolyl oligopeptidase family serine peptidase [Armatimonadota bacterium]HOM83971.1 prolyl oligopeptidase family serine peptidase [Armatimonadota bacterium]HPO74936.1 prolyl oligopeptidase family serine peptidase [Armatimonadota bacterium]HPT96508.1 prolyl oligopeptidase family serine peptidase [Armatimonadota bacterium]